MFKNCGRWNYVTGDVSVKQASDQVV